MSQSLGGDPWEIILQKMVLWFYWSGRMGRHRNCTLTQGVIIWGKESIMVFFNPYWAQKYLGSLQISLLSSHPRDSDLLFLGWGGLVICRFEECPRGLSCNPENADDNRTREKSTISAKNVISWLQPIALCLSVSNLLQREAHVCFLLCPLCSASGQHMAIPQ